MDQTREMMGPTHDDGGKYGGQQLGGPASGPARIEVLDAELAEEESMHGGGDLRLVGHARTVHVLRLSLPGLDGGLAAHRGGGSANRRWLQVSSRIVGRFPVLADSECCG